MDVSENRRYKPDESRIQEILCKADVCKGNRRGKDRAGVSLRKDCFLLELPQWKIRVEVSVPANTRADLFLPEKEESFEVGSGTHVYEYDTNTSLKELKFTLDSTLGEILDEPLGMKMMEEMLPELVHNPMIEYARQMTLAEGISSAPEVKAVYEAVLKELNAQM